MADQLPHNDPDLALVRELKKLREQGRPLSELDDRLIRQLVDYKEAKKSRSQAEASHKDEIWDEISAATAPTQKAKITYLFSSPVIRWAAAAILIIGGIFSYIYLGRRHHPNLLAQSNASIKTIALNGGGRVTLRPYSKLFILKRKASKVVYKLKGEAQFDVVHNPNRIFSIKTSKGIVTDLGTKFIVSTWGKQMKVFLLQGSVRVRSRKGNRSAALSPGESASVSDNGHLSVNKKANARAFTDWLKQRLVFDDKPVRRVAAELEQQFNISISLPDRIASQNISGQLSLKSLQESLSDLALALSGSFTQTGKRSYKFEAAAP
jgi:ferric-dicitrate binding protein FerR (iron transport regulator)